MKSFVFISFIKWIFRKLFSKIIKMNSQYRELIEEDLPAAIMVWIMCSLVFNVVVMIMALPWVETVGDISVVAICSVSASVLYFVVNGVTILYNAFKKEHQELFNILKDTR